ncbi:MAG: FAD-binding oxidoreductase [Thiomicrorhabdus sp.]|nr:FAD-binding oxidoreductase [Thiomicrorhabdus sp.]
MISFIQDASVYELTFQSIQSPENLQGLHQIVLTSLQSKTPITMRAGGTSLGGQAIGSGVIIDVSKYLNAIVEYHPEQKEIVVEPGVIQDDLNDFVAADGLRFAPDTSTSNRAMIGGMIGNNSCGSYSVLYGTTREHVKSVEVILSDGSEVTFSDLSADALQQKLQLSTLEGDIYRFVLDLLNRGGEKILAAFPDPSIKRRNTGYALDELYRHHQPFNPTGKPFNLTPLICGSEGTLAVIKRATLRLVHAPKHRKLICAHYPTVESALEHVTELLSFLPAAIELIDHITLESTKGHLQHQKNRFWIQGSPGAVLVIELFDDDVASLTRRIASLESWLLSQQGDGAAYAAPVIEGADAAKVWSIRKAGLGLLMGKVTRQKAVAVVEDAAIPVTSMADYYRDVRALMAELNVGCVYYGHASVGLIHVRPELDLATEGGREKFQHIAQRVSTLVKSYRGALSGEHGDGRIRAPFLPEQFGEEVYGYLVALKGVFDPENLLNPGVIIGDASITKQLRADHQVQVPLKTGLDWSADLSLMDAVEKCNGAGACRKSVGRGGMCPSYQATREEQYSTRGRSNLLRRALTEADPIKALSGEDLQEALALCLGCKACKNECPASVDMARLKSEVLYQTQGSQPWFKRLNQLNRLTIKHYDVLLHWGAKWPALFNAVQNRSFIKKIVGLDPRRALPEIQAFDVPQWWEDQLTGTVSQTSTTVWLLCDVFSLRQEPEVAKATLSCLQKMGVAVKPVYLTHSPRALISQGLLQEAKTVLKDILSQMQTVKPEEKVIGIEPAELLVWRDVLGALLPDECKQRAWLMRSKPVLSFEEWLLILQKQHKLPKFKKIPPPYASGKLWLHVHCHQKALANAEDSQKALQLIPELEVELIATGCCGMSGSFGYQHYDLSKKIAEQGILPALSQVKETGLIVATGTSCRHQIAGFSQKKSRHIAQVFDLVL